MDGREGAFAIGTKPGAIIIHCASTEDVEASACAPAGTLLAPPIVSNLSVTYTLKLLRLRDVIGRLTLLWDGAAVDLVHNNSSLRPLRSVLAFLGYGPRWSLTESNAT